MSSNFRQSQAYRKFKEAFIRQNLWIFKPGECTNRGFGIKVFNDLEKIEEHLRSYCEAELLESKQKKYKYLILQRYIKNPLLISKRKFDIRVFALLVAHTDTNKLRGYFYEEGYLRTSSKEFDLDKFDNKLIHLTNDAIQKGSSSYGRFEQANKVSYSDFERHLYKERGSSFEN